MTEGSLLATSRRYNVVIPVYQSYVSWATWRLLLGWRWPTCHEFSKPEVDSFVYYILNLNNCPQSLQYDLFFKSCSPNSISPPLLYYCKVRSDKSLFDKICPLYYFLKSKTVIFVAGKDSINCMVRKTHSGLVCLYNILRVKVL